MALACLAALLSTFASYLVSAHRSIAIQLEPDSIDVQADDHRIKYEGRWAFHPSKRNSFVADWPCTTVQFKLQVGPPGGSAKLLWYGRRTRVMVKVEQHGNLISQKIVNGCSSVKLVGGCFDRPEPIDIGQLSEGEYTVSMRKLTMAAPFSMGFGKAFLGTSQVKFYGLVTTGESSLVTPQQPSRRVEFVGASDTAGYCVDGDADFKFFDRWAYDNCDSAYPGVLGHELGAEIAVESLAGLGVTQNYDNKNCRIKVGCRTMPEYFLQTLQADQTSKWDFSQWIPQLVLLSLGGNDFNHQGDQVPSDEVFAKAYGDFLDLLFNKYENPVVAGICGMGTPGEKQREVDNDRCRPCPHVQKAVEAYAEQHSDRQVHYIFIPCDGTVATDADMGCDNHKNRAGQAKIAEFLEPQLRLIMGWAA